VLDTSKKKKDRNTCKCRAARECYFAKRFVYPQIHVFGLAKFLIDFDIERVLKAYALKQFSKRGCKLC